VPLTIGPNLQRFFAAPLLAIVCTTTERGAPEMTPIWYEYADGDIWFNGEPTRHWLQRMESTRRATFFLLDPQNGWKWAQIYGRVVAVADDPRSEQFARVAQRYGRPLDRVVPNRRYARVRITSVKGRAGSPTEPWDTTQA
jgi:hypothetical protein